MTRRMRNFTGPLPLSQGRNDRVFHAPSHPPCLRRTTVEIVRQFRLPTPPRPSRLPVLRCRDAASDHAAPQTSNRVIKRSRPHHALPKPLDPDTFARGPSEVNWALPNGPIPGARPPGHSTFTCNDKAQATAGGTAGAFGSPCDRT